MREKRLETYLQQAVEFAIVTTAGYIKMDWNATSGDIYDYDEDGNPLYDGDVEFDVLGAHDVFFESKKSVGVSDWVVTRTFKNNKDIIELGTLKRNQYLKYLQKAFLVVVPGSGGPGTKIKIIESLSYNKTTLASCASTKGIVDSFKKDYTYKNLREFENKLISVKNNKVKKYILIGKFFRNKYNIKNILRNFYAEIKSL
jgi:hypothetical protein